MIAFLISSDVRTLVIAALALIMVFAAWKAWQGRARRVTPMPPPDDHGGGHGDDHGGGHGGGGHHHPPEPFYDSGTWLVMFLLSLGLNPKLWGKRELHRSASATSKAVVIVHGFSFGWRIWEFAIFAGLLAGITILFRDNKEALLIAFAAYTVIAALYHVGFFKVRVINYAVEKDGEDLTGVVYLAGRHWRFPFAYDVDLVDYRVRRTTATFFATLRNGGRIENKLPIKWRPEPTVFNPDGENTYFHQGAEAVEQSALQQASEISALEAELDDVQFQKYREALVLFQQCQMQVARNRLPHYDRDFLARVGRRDPVHGAVDRLEFYRVHRSSILELLDPVPGDATHEEGGIGHTHSYFEELNGVEVEDSALLPDFDANTQRIVQAKMAGEVVRGIIGSEAKVSAQDALAMMDKATVISTQGSGGSGPAIVTVVEKGHH